MFAAWRGGPPHRARRRGFQLQTRRRTRRDDRAQGLSQGRTTRPRAEALVSTRAFVEGEIGDAPSRVLFQTDGHLGVRRLQTAGERGEPVAMTAVARAETCAKVRGVVVLIRVCQRVHRRQRKLPRLLARSLPHVVVVVVVRAFAPSRPRARSDSSRDVPAAPPARGRRARFSARVVARTASSHRLPPP